MEIVLKIDSFCVVLEKLRIVKFMRKTDCSKVQSEMKVFDLSLTHSANVTANEVLQLRKYL